MDHKLIHGENIKVLIGLILYEYDA